MLRAFFSALRCAELSLSIATQLARVRISTLSQCKTGPNGPVLHWRRRRDSNSRTGLPPSNDLANRPLQPLGYSSVSAERRLPRSSCVRRNIGDGAVHQFTFHAAATWVLLRINRATLTTKLLCETKYRGRCRPSIYVSRSSHLGSSLLARCKNHQLTRVL